MGNTHKSSNFDVIDYPLKLKDSKVPFYVKVDATRYEFRILDTIDSKRIYATKKKKQNELLLHLRIENEECQLIGSTTQIFEFNNSCDFYLEQNESTSIYNNFTNKILTGSLNDLISSSKDFFGLVETNNLPEYSPLILNSTLSDVINLKLPPTVLPEQCKFKIKYSDEVPKECNKEYEKAVKEYLKDDLETIKAFFTFINDPVARISFISKLLKSFNASNNETLSIEKVKKALPIFRYYYHNGPWRKSWIVYGVDPKTSQEFYKYQIVDLRTDSKFYTLKDNEKIVKEIEEHKDWYLKDKCDKKHGYFKKALEQLILYDNYIDFTDPASEEDNAFELFDI